MTSFRGPRVKVSRCQGVKANFHRVALEALRPVAPRIAFRCREGPVKFRGSYWSGIVGSTGTGIRVVRFETPLCVLPITATATLSF